MKHVRSLLNFLLLAFVIQHGTMVLPFADPASHRREQRLPFIQDRVSRVENGLLSPIRIKGEPLVKMNIVDRMKNYGVPGVSIAVINDGKVEWAKGYGVAEAGTSVPVTAETLFQAGSISKPVAAMGALRMVQDGKLSLDEDVNKKLVSWKLPESEFTKTEKVTLRRILTHTAGTSVWGFGGYRPDVKILPTASQILQGGEPANSDPVRVIETPGTRNAYSGGGYTIMQLLMSEVSGKSFPDMMNQTVFEKLGMKNSSYEQPLSTKLHAQTAHAHGPKGEKPPFRWFVYPEMAAAGLWTTPTDLAQFVIELQKAYAGRSAKVLSREMVRQMLSKQTGGWGLGVALAGEGSKAARFFHGGANQGFRNEMVGYVEAGQGAIVMANGEQGRFLAAEILRGIALEYGWDDYLPKEKVLVPVDLTQAAAYVGDYDFLGRAKYVVSIEGGKLKLKGTGPEKFDLLAESQTKFVLKERAGEVVFMKDKDGKVTEMVIYTNGQEIRLKKL